MLCCGSAPFFPFSCIFNLCFESPECPKHTFRQRGWRVCRTRQKSPEKRCCTGREFFSLCQRSPQTGWSSSRTKSPGDRDHWQRPQSFISFCGCLSGSKGDRSFWISGFGFECFDVSIPFADCGVGKAVRILNINHLNRFTCFERFLCGQRN